MDGHGNKLILPDSRLARRPDLGTFMADWPLPSGGTVRVEVQPVYCANCGKLWGHVPKDNTGFAFWLCARCFEGHGPLAGTYAVPEDAFNRALAHEMEERFGRHLSDGELAALAERGELGRAIELLARESPYPVYGGD